MIGGSRTESHISAHAVSHLERAGEDPEDAAPAYQDVGPILETQQLEQEEEEGEDEEDDEAVPLAAMDGSDDRGGVTASTAVLRGNRERIIRGSSGMLFYGQTPALMQKLDFKKYSSMH